MHFAELTILYCVSCASSWVRIRQTPDHWPFWMVYFCITFLYHSFTSFLFVFFFRYLIHMVYRHPLSALSNAMVLVDPVSFVYERLSYLSATSPAFAVPAFIRAFPYWVLTLWTYFLLRWLKWFPAIHAVNNQLPLLWGYCCPNDPQRGFLATHAGGVIIHTSSSLIWI